MKSEWYYSRDGKDFGPVSSAELRQLAATGKLLQTDLLWKEGMADWKPAAQFPKLFPDEKPAAAIIADEAGQDPLASFKLDVDPSDKKSAKAEAPASVADNLASLQVDVAAAGRKAMSQVKSHARTAGKVAALSAERMTITTVKLPQAYGRLGASCYQSGSHAGDFPDLFSRITAIQAGRPENRQSAVANDGPAIEKAKAWATLGLNLAKSQVQGIQAKALFIQLGKVCLQRFGEKAGPSDLITSIESLKSRLAEIDAQAEGKRRKSGGISKLVAYGGGLLFGVIVIGTCTYDLGNDKVIRPLAENLPRDPERREAYEEGWERGAADGNKWLEEVRELAEGKPLDEYTKSNPSILARKDSLIDEFQSGLDTNIRTLKALFESAESEDHVRRFALIVEEQHGLRDGFKEVVEAGLEGKETSTATVARKETRTLSRGSFRDLHG